MFEILNHQNKSIVASRARLWCPKHAASRAGGYLSRHGKELAARICLAFGSTIDVVVPCSLWQLLGVHVLTKVAPALVMMIIIAATTVRHCPSHIEDWLYLHEFQLFLATIRLLLIGIYYFSAADSLHIFCWQNVQFLIEIHWRSHLLSAATNLTLIPHIELLLLTRLSRRRWFLM